MYSTPSPAPRRNAAPVSYRARAAPRGAALHRGNLWEDAVSLAARGSIVVLRACAGRVASGAT